ncbi:UNVERIFIED_CONTAM: hypothetical protein Slati_3514100 [Sesamum latifolium]|uniref:Uncharacterized protein n=1 Tax=Sesamum latifolium TaxID=2727402 RepID=A0AAW2UKC2_9LAMI
MLAHARVATPSDIDATEEEAEGDVVVPVPLADMRQGAPPLAPQEVPPQWLARFECLQKGLQDVQYQIGGAPNDERQGVPFKGEIMADELPLNWKEPNCQSTTGPWIRRSTSPVLRILPFSTVTPSGSNAVCS